MALDNELLQGVRVASPCPASWDAMTGDERSRMCGQCNLHVYNLSGMSAAEAIALVKRREGRLCVRFFRRRDGTMITSDCPRGSGVLGRRIIKVAAAVLAMLGLGALLSPPIPSPPFMGSMSLLPLPESRPPDIRGRHERAFSC